ncbi:TPA: hypothetical protein ACG0AN_002828 [Enterobacter kobei]
MELMNTLTDKRARLRMAAQDCQSVLSWYQENPDNPNAEQDCNEATEAFMREIGHRAPDIIAKLFDEIDELQESLRASPWDALRQLAEEKRKRGEQGAATALNYAASALQKELEK